MKRFLLFFALLACISSIQAQGVLKGNVLDKVNNEAASFASVRVLNQRDSAFVKGAVTDINGAYNVSGLSAGKYILTVSYVGYEDAIQNFTIKDSGATTTIPTIYMAQDEQSLKEVTVVGLQSAMKLEVDRKSYDVSQMIANSGDAASDVLGNIPSIEVDNDGNISLRGNSSVEVWINGRASGMSSDNQAEILQQLPAESIDHIEVIDNPSAKFSAEGSAGIINIVLKKDLDPGYYGSVQAGANTLGNANTSFNINYNSSKWDAYLNVGYRHRANKGSSASEQKYLISNEYQNSNGTSSQSGNNLFTRAGVTFKPTKKDDFTLSGMFMQGGRNSWNNTLYSYGNTNPQTNTYNMMRRNHGEADMNMFYGEFSYRHTFSDRHILEVAIDYDNWKSDNTAIYQDSTTYIDPIGDTTYGYQNRPTKVRNHEWEAQVDYENTITDNFRIQAGYRGDFSRNNTPQSYFEDNTNWDGSNQTEDPDYFNRFIYDRDRHALYATASYKFGKLSVMGGLRGEYWKVNTSTYNYAQEYDATLRDKPYKTEDFALFPSFFLTYQISDNDEVQINYTRRLRRPRGGQLNSFRNTSDASMISFGNPELSPEYSNSFTMNYLRTWTQHSLMLSAYYRPTTDVIQSINYQSDEDGLMYSTPENVAKSMSSGVEAVLKNRFFKILDLTTSANAYNYSIDAFDYKMGNQTVSGDASHSFTWSASMLASVRLPYDMTFQATGRYYSKRAITQGYAKPNYNIDLGLRKNFFNKKLVLALNCRDLLNSRKRQTYTSSDTFTRFQMNKRGERSVRLTVTYNFGDAGIAKKKEEQQNRQNNDEQNGGFND